MRKSEAFSRVIIDAMLAAQAWNTTDPNAVPFEVAMADGTREFSDRKADVLSVQSQQYTATAKAKATFDSLLSRMFSN
jgi:predicted type IV restriction endonuclease